MKTLSVLIGLGLGFIFSEFYLPWADKMIKKLKKKKQPRRINEKEREKGRSADYWQMDVHDQWEEDKRLGILDWDGN